MVPVLLFLLALATIYVGSVETAFTLLMRLSLRFVADRGGREDRLARYLDDPAKLFIPIRLLLGVLFACATILLAILIGRGGWQSIAALILSVAVFSLVCEHLLPTLLVRRNPQQALELLLPSFDRIAGFLRGLPVSFVRLVRRVTGHPRDDRDAEEPGEPTAEPPAEAAEAEAADAPLIEREERQLIRSIVDFGDTLAREVMTPRPDIVAIHSTATVRDARALFREQEYSRVPVFTDNLDNIVGIVYVKDFLLAVEARDDEPVTAYVRPAMFVPETKRVPDLLREFQRRQAQMAIVVDEYGGTAGLVTIEDLLEEIVGEIRDEYDVEAEPIVEEPDGAFTFSAKINIAEVNERLGVAIKPEGFETLGGYLLSQIGRVPAVGEVFELDGLEVVVLEAERRRIHKVRMRRVPVEAPQAEA
ncbi:MAG: hemolysin family protein [Vicinamibacterales bacterium]